MTKDVTITIEGIQLGSPEEKIITKAKGFYYLKNGKHFIQYEENAQKAGNEKNILKITPEQIDITRNGGNGMHMIFVPYEITDSLYHTPYGSLNLQVYTKSMIVTESSDEIQAALLYTLSEDGSIISENSLEIRIKALK